MTFDRKLKSRLEANTSGKSSNPTPNHITVDPQREGRTNMFACIDRILKTNPSAASAVNLENRRLPLHTALANGTISSDIIRLLLDSYPVAVQQHDSKMELPLHLGLKSLENVLSDGETCKHMLIAISSVIEMYPSAASTRDNDGYTPLFRICKTLQASHEHPKHSSQVMAKIFKAYPEAAEIACSVGACPMNILVEECSNVDLSPADIHALDRLVEMNSVFKLDSWSSASDTHALRQLMEISRLMQKKSIFKLKTLLAAIRDGRSLRTLCNLHNPVSLLVFFLLFDEGHESESRIPLVNLNKQLIPGWTLLEMLADFDTSDSSSVVLQIVQGQRAKLNQDRAEFSIEYLTDDGISKVIMHFCSVQAIREAVLVHVADRAKLAKSSTKLKQWGQEHGRMLRRYRVENDPKHISETCVVVFATEAKEDIDGHHYESPVALKFMSQKDAFCREIEKRRGTEEEFVLPIRAFFTKEQTIDIDCEYICDRNFGVALHEELLPYPNISLKDSNKARDQSMGYLLVMECGSGTDLHDVIGHQNIAGKDPFSVISIAKEIARCLEFLNEKCGIIHGDVKARNFVSRGVGLLGFAAIDLDNAASIVEGEAAGKKRTSSGCLPPEQAAIEVFRRFDGPSASGDTASIDLIKEELQKALAANDFMEVARLSQQATQLSPQKQTAAPPDVIATIQYDMWCFGVLLYYLCTGIQLFNVDVREEIVEEDDLVKLKLWEEKVKTSKLAKVGHGWPRQLLSKLLEKDPSDRPQTWRFVTDELSKLGMNDSTNRRPRSSSSPPEPSLHDRVVVFRSDPLVYIDLISKTPVPVGRMDYEKEADMLVTSLRDADAVGAKIDVIFESATIDALSAFFAQRSSRVLHFSGHGHPQYLALENGFGQLQTMLVADLKEYVSNGGGHLQLVVVSACHSRNTGEAFIKAGVPHVVCCQLEEQLLDTAAQVFAGNLYRALGCGSNLRAAFDMAREAVRFSPQVENSRWEAGKFLLLPEQGVNHDIPVFFTQPVTQLTPSNQIIQMNGVPRLPESFVGREIDMYNVITAIRSADVIKISGVMGVGKSSVISAVCGYIRQRPRSFPLDYLFWLEASSPSSLSSFISNGTDAQSNIYRELTSAFHAALEEDILTDNTEYSSCLARLSSLLDQKRIYLVFNCCNLAKDDEVASKSEQFINDLLTIPCVKAMKILWLSSSTKREMRMMGSCHITTHGRHEASVKIGPLDFEHSAMVFSSHLPFSLRSRYPDLCMSSPTALARHLQPPEQLIHVPTFQATYNDLWARLGKGIPSRIRFNAMNMTENEMSTIINWWGKR